MQGCSSGNDLIERKTVTKCVTIGDWLKEKKSHPCTELLESLKMISST